MLSGIVDFALGIVSRIPMYVQYMLVPIIAFFWLWKSKNKCKADWLLKVLPSLGYMGVLVYTASSDITVGYYTPYFLLILVIAAAVLSLLRLKGKPFFVKKGIPGYMLYGLSIIIVFVTSYINITSLRACFYAEKAVELAFPFRNGTYLAVEGGDGKISSMMNYHYQDEMNIKLKYYTAERYANDIIKLNRFGLSVKSFTFSLNTSDLLPKDLDQYEIFGETVYSPCDGTVFYVQNNYSDIPITGVRNYSDTGNGVVIKYNDVYVMMWHMKKGSITVRAGEHVAAGQPIGLAGNSGITTLPHLHIMAARGGCLYGTGVPIIFDGQNPVKGSIFVK